MSKDISEVNDLLRYLEEAHRISEDNIQLLTTFIQSVKVLDEQLTPTKDVLNYLARIETEQLGRKIEQLESIAQILLAAKPHLSPAKVKLLKTLEGVSEEQIENLVRFIKNARAQINE